MVKVGSIVIVHRTREMKRAKSFERRINKLLKNENGKRLHDGVFWFSYEDSAHKLVKLAEDFGMSTTKEIMFRKKDRIPQIMLFKNMQATLASIELKAAEAQAEKEIEELARKVLTAGTEHQKE